MLPGAFEAAASDDLKGFDAALCEGLETATAAVFPLVAPLVFPGLALAAAADFVRGDCPRCDLGDFLRDFLDIRLPFVAFGRSIIGLLRVPSGTPAKIGGWASLTAPEYGYKEFDAAPVLSLNELKAG